ncbi:Carbohydrate family 9 binding domain-like [Tangfeifania diversioriginum]|uniref:Carbohydrate family 9 binding domain-like n=1 Tax=Tangfeifania diversioriginum TaxID=1168035 RepID=A0A1M6K6A5_9BACT|nr:DUF5916 domain-containing protein [Tangfeifania diversioriginum]SHJ54506.1 Carbohydrate family 9 binding domain-like [Tangfeifania diversioriginum]
MKTMTMFFLCLIFTPSIVAQEISKKRYIANLVNGYNINVDGKLDEPAWQSVKWENKFVQFEPNEGNPPYQQTEFAILYDEHNIYVAIKAIDKNPGSISMRMTRRDDIDGDQVGIGFDTYYDRRTAFMFAVSAVGVKVDWVISNDGENEDFSWDPIWWVKTTTTENGWNTEMRIPLTQLRFREGEEQTWGLQVFRTIFREEELSTWQHMKRDASGLVSQFGTMNGLKHIQPKKTLDVMPYVVARTERFEKDLDNPFRKNGKSNNLNAGLDAKLGLTNFLTLDLTINPDFGQVEADPSEVNLSTHETFFEEKRPFFIEGKNILKYKLMFGDGDLASDGLFYSRRIGSQPHYSPDLENDEYARMPEFTRILGAAKVTGKTPDGWSVGILESVTAEEDAQIRGVGNSREQTVEPLTNYFVSRIQKDFNDGNTYLGGMLTAVNRKIDNTQLDFLHTSAYSGGIDFIHKWNNKNWMLDAGWYFSHVKGSQKAIRNTQESYIRSFQRPDADYVNYDTTRTSLTGQGGKLTLGKLGGNLKFMGGVAWKSPELEINDIGYAQQVDNIFQIFWAGYRIYEPFSIFREISLNLNQWVQFDFGGNVTAPGGNINWWMNFKNYWNAYGNFNVGGTQLSNSMLRGGPSMKLPGYKNIYLGFSTNQQKKLTFSFSTGHYFSNEKDFENNQNYNLGIGYRPFKSLRIDVSPGFNKSMDELQYVTQKDFENEKRYILGRIERNTLNMSVRLNYNITPDLTIQYWGQPFIATGKYSDFKYATNTKADDVNNRYQYYSENQISYNANDELYFIAEARNNQADYEFDQPNFNVKEFLSNLVVRWEYRPGSTLFLVWSQNRDNFENSGNFRFQNDVNQLFGQKAHNIFLVKLSYRLGR